MDDVPDKEEVKLAPGVVGFEIDLGFGIKVTRFITVEDPDDREALGELLISVYQSGIDDACEAAGLTKSSKDEDMSWYPGYDTIQ